MDSRHFDVSLRTELSEKATLLLCQINFWHAKENVGIFKDQKKYIYNTLQEWGRQIACSPRTISRLLNELIGKGYIECSHVMRNRYNRTNCIALTTKAIAHFWSKKPQKDPETLKNSIETRCLDDITNNTSSNKINNNISSKKSPFSLKEFFNWGEKKEKIKMPEELKPILKKVMLTEDGRIPHKIATYDFSKIEDLEQSKKIALWLMAETWNLILANHEIKKTSLNKELMEKAWNAFEGSFNKSMLDWIAFLRKIGTSDFLSNKNQFNLYFHAALSEGFINKIKNGELGVSNDPLVPEKKIALSHVLKEHIDGLEAPEIEKNLKLYLLKKIGAYSYEAWFKNLKFDFEKWNQDKDRKYAQLEILDGCVSPFVKKYVRDNYGQYLNMFLRSYHAQ